MKVTLFLMLVFVFVAPVYSQITGGDQLGPCYSEQIKWNTRDSTYKDTVVLFRNYEDESGNKRILCKGQTPNAATEQLVWDSPYIGTYLKYQERLNKFSFIGYKANSKGQIIASYYLCDRKTKKSVEMIRLKLGNEKITGINPLPCCQDVFIPVEEYDKQNGFVEM